MSYKNPIEMLAHWAMLQPQKTFLRQPISKDNWQEYSWEKVYSIVQQIAVSLKNQGLKPGDRVAILANNSAHWVMCDLGIMLANMVSVPLYTNQHAESLRFILEHCKAKLIFLGPLGPMEHPEQLLPAIPPSIMSVMLPYEKSPAGSLQWKAFLSTTNAQLSFASIQPNDLATIMYTSGTTGNPKGVMHQFSNISFANSNFVSTFTLNSTDKYFSYLPLCHAAERFLVELNALYSGGMISFNESLSTFPDYLRQSSPTFFMGVPRIWYKLREAVLAKLSQEQQALIYQTSSQAEQFKQTIRQQLGLHNMRIAISGAAPIAPEIIKWFHALGVPMTEGYAMTENCAYCSINFQEDNRIGTVGKALAHTEIKISDAHEILVKNAATTQGYYLEPELTEEAFTKDGFLRTGDMGKLDHDGFLTITGRVKDLFKTSKGKYIAPALIENKLATHPFISQVCLVGSGLTQPIALVVLTEITRSLTRIEIENQLKIFLQEINKTLENHEKISQLIITSIVWSPDNNFLTPTQKIKRHIIEKHYQGLIEKASGSAGMIFWE